MRAALYDLRKRYENGECPEISFQVPGENTICKRRFQSPSRLIILGGGHVAQSLCKFASELEFRVVVADDRPAFANRNLFPKAAEIICDTFENALLRIGVRTDDFIAVVTRGHREDAACLRILLAENTAVPIYLGLLGSRLRTKRIFELLQEEGFDRKKMDRIQTPIGVNIAAVTPDEIGISILAELILYRQSASMKQQGLLEQTGADERLLAFLEKPEEKVLAVVVERNGSTPVRTGAAMAVDRMGVPYGTVGGGCGEHEVIMKAMKIFRTGKDCTMAVDMNNDDAMNEGTVCGGKMKVALYFIPERDS